MKKRFGTTRCCVPAVLAVVFLTAATSRSVAQNQLCNSGVCVKTWQQDTGTGVASGYTYRSGQNLQETILTPTSIQTQNFQKLCATGAGALDGQVYAQPLVMTNVTVQSNPPYTGTVVYVVTENDTVYAIQGSPPAAGQPCKVLLSASLLNNNLSGNNPPTMSAVNCMNVGTGQTKCGTIAPSIGILGTPVIGIDSTGTKGTLYAVAEMQSGTAPPFSFYHFLHALDITTLNEGIGNENFGAPIQICPGVCGTTGSVFSFYHIQRPALLYSPASLNGLLSNDIVYIAFSMMDGAGWPYPNGAVFAYDATALSTVSQAYFQTSVGQNNQNSNGGGIWMGGGGPAFGPDKNHKDWVYLTTANGTWDGITNWGDSFLQLDPGLQIADMTQGSVYGYLTPVDQYFRSAWNAQGGVCPKGGDVDFGSGAAMLIPDNALLKWPQLAVNGEKEGGLWFMDRTTPGGHNPKCDQSQNPCSCTLSGNNPSFNIQTFWAGTQYAGQVIQGGLAYWESSAPQSYIFAGLYGRQTGVLNRYPLCGGANDSYPICQNTSLSAAPIFPTGVTPTISAASFQAPDAIVWAVGGQKQDQSTLPTLMSYPGVLYAFDAVNMTTLYSSAACARDVINPSTKFSVPTVANGYVYVGTESDNMNTVGQGTFYIFGPSGTACHQ